MKRAFDLSSVQAILQHGINRGLWTLEDLDRPSLDYQRNLREARKSSSCLLPYRDWETDRKSTRLNSSHSAKSRMPSSA